MIVVRYICACMEAIALIMAATGLTGVKVVFKQVVLSGMLLGFFVIAVRWLYQLFAIPLGTHTLVIATLFIIILYRVVKAEFGIALVGGISSLTLYASFETIVVFLCAHIGMDIQASFYSPTSYIFISFVSQSVLWLVAFITRYYNINIFGNHQSSSR